MKKMAEAGWSRVLAVSSIDSKAVRLEACFFPSDTTSQLDWIPITQLSPPRPLIEVVF
jgi:hypothetical protein